LINRKSTGFDRLMILTMTELKCLVWHTWQ